MKPPPGLNRWYFLGGAAALGTGLVAWKFRPKAELDLAGKSVLITGGSRGLGLQLAREFGAHGGRISICARDRDELKRARVDLESRGISVHAIACDVTEPMQVNSMVNEMESRFGAVDILVNNAGVIQVGPLASMNVSDFVETMSVMFWGPLYTTLAVLPRMRERRAGCIVNVTSVGGKVSVPHLVPYSCAKFAAVALSEGLRAELAGEGIQVVTAVPGLMRTGSHLQARFKGDHAREFAWFSLGASTPLISVSAAAAARSIVRSVRRGAAINIISLPANLLARLHGAWPELVVPILGLIARMLPASSGTGEKSESGSEAQSELHSKLHRTLITLGTRAAADLNEIAAER